VRESAKKLSRKIESLLFPRKYLRDRCTGGGGGGEAHENKYKYLITGFEVFQNNCHPGHSKFIDECLTSGDLSANLSQS
jgi:hypothetical protein